MAVLALVHGAYHGAACWDRLVPELEERGHRAVTMDLPSEDPQAGCADYAKVVEAALTEAGAGDDVVLVGHSLGGLTIPLVAEARPVRRMVFLCAFLPQPGMSLDQQAGEESDMVCAFEAATGAIAHPDGSASVPEGRALELYYPDAAPSLARQAAAHLRRQFWKPTQEITPMRAWPPVPASYVLTTADRIVSPRWSRRAAVERLGIEPIEMAGDHSPFLARPDELADVLVDLAG